MEDYDGIVRLGVELDTEEFESDVEDLEDTTENITDKTGSVADTILNKITRKSKGIVKVVAKISKGILNIVGTTYLITLALIGIIGTLAVLWKAFKKAWSENKQAKADIDYIKYALKEAFYTAIKPLVNGASNFIDGIVNALYKLLQYINYISIAWFKVNLFENASVKNFKKAEKEAKKFKQILAGFDELDILNSGGNNEEILPLPSIDLSKVNDIEVPKWIDWIAKNKDIVVGAIEAITGALIAMKLFGLDPISALGIGLAIINIIKLIKDLKDLFNDPTWENFKKVLKDLSLAFIGVGIAALVTFGLSNPVGWALIAIGAIGLVIAYWDELKQKFEKSPQWFQTTVKTLLNLLISFLNTMITKINSFLAPLNTVLEPIFSLFGKKSPLHIPQIKYISYDTKLTNTPSKGTPVGINAFGGVEDMKKSILQDSEELAKYMTINLTNVTDLDGRTIARSIKKIQGQNDFAMNR